MACVDVMHADEHASTEICVVTHCSVPMHTAVTGAIQARSATECSEVYRSLRVPWLDWGVETQTVRVGRASQLRALAFE